MIEWIKYDRDNPLVLGENHLFYDSEKGPWIACYKTDEEVQRYTHYAHINLPGAFDPTPPVQPDIKVGDKVRHKLYKSYGDGIVGEISSSGKSAWVRPWSAYYRLDKLEVIIDDQR